MNLVSMKNEDGELLLKLADNLDTVGVKMRDSNGKLLSTFNILKQLSGKWKDIDQDMQMSLLEDIAGKRQANILASIISNWSEVEETYNDAINSQGSAMAELSKYQEGLQYSIDVLKENLGELYRSFVDSDFLKVTIDGVSGLLVILDTLVNKFGAFNTIVFTISTTMLMFSDRTKGIADSLAKSILPTQTLEKALKGVGTSATTSATSAQVAKVGFLGLNGSALALTASTVALQAALSLGLSLAITAVVSGISTLISKMNEGSRATREYNDALSGLDEVKSIEDLVKRLSDKNITEEESLDIRRQIAQLNPELIKGYDSEGNAISGNIDELREYIKLKYEEMAIKSLAKKDELLQQKKSEQEQLQYLKESVERQKKMQKGANNKEAFDESIASLNKRIAESEQNLKSYDSQILQVDSSLVKYAAQCTSMGDSQQDIVNNLVNMGIAQDVATKAVDEATQKLKENTDAKLENMSIDDAIGMVKTDSTMDSEFNVDVKYSIDDENRQAIVDDLEGLTDEQKNIILTADPSQVYEVLNEIKDNMPEFAQPEDGLGRLQSFLLNIKATTEELTRVTKTYTDAIESGVPEAEALNAAYGDTMATAISNMDKIKNLQDAINKKGTGDSDVVKTIASDYPQLLSKMSDRKALQEELNNLMDDEKSKYSQAYAEIMADDAAWYQQKIATNSALQNSINSFCSFFKDAQGNAYQIDLKNYKTLAEMKNALTQGMSEPLAQWLTNVVGGQSSAYQKDLQNFKSLGEAKAYVIAKVDEQITKLESRMAQSLRNSADAIKALNMGSSSSDAEAAQIESDYLRLQARLEKAIAALQASKADIDKSFNDINASFDTTAPNLSGVGSGGSGGSSGSGSGSDSQKEEYKATVDRYRQLQIELEKINKLLELNNILSQNANSKDKVRLAQERIELLKKQKQALENLNAEQKKSLSETKSSIQNAGGIFDSNGTLTNYQQVLTKYTGDSAKAIENLIKQYDELNDKIADTSNQIEDVKNSTIDAYKTIGDALKEQWQKETDTLKAEINKRKDALNKQKEDQTYEDQRFEAQKKLTDLQQRRTEALRSGNMSVVNQLDEEIRQATKELNDLIRDKEFDNTNNRFDEELDKLDEQLDKKVEAMEQEIQNGNLMKYLQNNGINLATIFDDVNSASRSVNSNMIMVGSSIDSWNDSLNVFKNNLASIQSSLSLSLNSNSLNSNQQGRSVNINSPLINLTVQGNGATVVNELEIKNLLDDYSNDILKQINDIYK